jgi:hypothetical protein
MGGASCVRGNPIPICPSQFLTLEVEEEFRGDQGFPFVGVDHR